MCKTSLIYKNKFGSICLEIFRLGKRLDMMSSVINKVYEYLNP